MTGPVTAGPQRGFALDAALPVNVLAGRAPTRIGFLPTGSLIINDSNNRVWIGPSSSTGYQAGTPLDGKTTFRITRDGEYFGFIDPAGTGDSQLYVSPYIAEWSPSPVDIALQVLATGVTLRDNPGLIGLSNAQVVPYSQPISDVRQWMSYTLKVFYLAPNAGPPQNTALVTVKFWEEAAGLNELWRNTFEVNSINTTDCGPTHITDMMRGPYMSIDFAAGNGAADNLSFINFGSNRTVARATAMEIGATPTRGIGTDRAPFIFAESVNAGATTNVTTRLATGPGIIALSTPGGGTWDIFFYSPAIGSTRRLFNFNAVAALTDFRERITFPGRVMTAFIRNNGAVAATPFISMFRDDM